MVLGRALALLVLIAGCKQSLFDSDPGSGGTDASVAVPSMCPDACVGDLAGDFDHPSARPWRYVEDNRKHAWMPMTLAGGIATGVSQANSIASCEGSDAAACSKLPGALLISSAGAQAAADPAVEFTVTTNQVLRVDLAAYLDSGASQVVRLYRNSREDVLYTGTVDPGATVASSITFDALAGDRILVAIAPMAAGAKDLGLQLYLSDTGAVFGGDCLLALEFAPITGTVVKNNCGLDFTSQSYDNTAQTLVDKTLVEVPGPYTELGFAGSLKGGDVGDTYTSTAIINRHGDSTTQLWFQWNGAANEEYGWFISDVDYENGGGIGFDIGSDFGAPPILLGAYTGMAMSGVGVSAGFSGDHNWHFARIVYTTSNQTLSVCLDGAFVKSATMIPEPVTAQPVYIGYNHDGAPDGAYLDGNVDDVRIFHSALPCASN